MQSAEESLVKVAMSLTQQSHYLQFTVWAVSGRRCFDKSDESRERMFIVKTVHRKLLWNFSRGFLQGLLD